MSRFELHYGIDYSGAKTAQSSLPGLQVFAASCINSARKKPPPVVGKKPNWSRQNIAEFFLGHLERNETFIAGIDHAFSFPVTYLDHHNLVTWDNFLADFCCHWPTNRQGVTCASLLPGNLRKWRHHDFRLTECWTSSAKSVFDFNNVPGQVAKSSHAGIPWLDHIRRVASGRIHFWPFDGWDIPPGKSVIVEVYPSLLRRRYDAEGRSPDEHDAYSIARWLDDLDRHDLLDHYLHPPLRDAERSLAEREGWILGVA